MGLPLLYADQLRLIAITDDMRDGVSGIVARSAAAVRGGATMVQLRLKHASADTLLEVARALVAALPVPVIVNDRADVAIAARAAGVHLGADDVPVRAVRGMVAEGFIIGASIGADNEVENAALADYVGIGPAFQTGTKSDAGTAIGAEGIMRLARRVNKPAVAIGGINADNVAKLHESGACGIAVVNAVFGAGNPEEAARSLRAAVDAWERTRAQRA